MKYDFPVHLFVEYNLEHRMRVHFTKLSGAGNDFVLIDNRQHTIANASQLARRLCDRREGIGADGLLLLEESKRAAYRMEYYNADGSYGGMCGNGGRCIAYYATENRIAGPEHSFEALDFVYSARVKTDRVTLSMKDPKDIRLNLDIELDAPSPTEVYYVDTGAPHVVIRCSGSVQTGTGLDTLPVLQLGRAVRNHPAFAPEGTNVNFVEFTGSNSLRMRTYERGVETETLACGTGAVSAAVIAAMKYGMSSPITVQTRSGHILCVKFQITGDGTPTRIELTGPAEKIFEGWIEIGDERTRG